MGMRKARLLVHESFEGVAYHVVSRVVHKQMLFGPEEKDKLVSLMRRYERFSGVRVLTYCVMGNHFHWLVEVPQRPKDVDSISDETLVARVRGCQGKGAAEGLARSLKYFRERGYMSNLAALRARWLKRMWNLSAFVQSVKQRFSHWYNTRHKQRGTLWEERFKSVIAMGPEAIASVAAYIDLNPVRAGLVADPKDYAWSGYGEASRGDGAQAKHAKAGLKQALCHRAGGLLGTEEKDYLEWYRGWIYGRGLERGLNEDNTPMKSGFKLKKVEEEQRRLPAADTLSQRVRYFTDGLAVGTKEMLERVFEGQRAYFGPKRKNGAKKMRQGEWGGLSAMRDLQLPRVVSE
jgi:REP element-mobilizing transposase RayT